MEKRRLPYVQKHVALDTALACFHLPTALAFEIATQILIKGIQQSDPKTINHIRFHEPRHGAPPSTRPTIPANEHWENWLWE